jgi:hypothetical protein
MFLDNNPRYGIIVAAGPTAYYTQGRDFHSASPQTFGFNSRINKYRQKVTQGVINSRMLISVAPVYFQAQTLTPAGLGGAFHGQIVTQALLEMQTNNQ